MLDGQHRGSVRLIPVGGPLVQRPDDVGFGAAQLPEQELAEQAVIAVPLPPPVERSQEQAVCLGTAQLCGRGRRPEHRLAKRARELVEDGRPPQEPLNGLRLPDQGLPVQVVRHVPVVAGDGLRPAVALPLDQGGEVEADRPAFGPFGHRRRQLRGHADLRARKDLLGAGHVESQVAGPELQGIAQGPEPRQVRLLGTACGYQLGSTGNGRDHYAQHVVAGGRLQLMKIIQHQDERHRARAELRGQPWRRAVQH